MPPAVLIPAIIGAAGVGTSAVMAHKQTNATNNIADIQRQAFLDQQARTKPAYDQAFNYYSGLLSGDPSKIMAALGPDIASTSHQFDAARNNIINGAVSRGGGLDRGLANLEAGRATSLSGLIQGVRPMAAQALSALASGQSAQGLQALAGAQQSQYQNQLLQQQSLGGIGSFITRLLSNPSMFGGGGGNSYFGVNMNQGGSIPPAAIVPRTGQPYPGWNDPYPSLI